MRRARTAAIVIGCLLAVGVMAGQDQPAVGYEGLANLDRLFTWTGKVQTAMSSSTDPAAGNVDMSQFHGKYQGENILAKIEGPGCVYRVWSAMPSGRIKVYLDGSDRPEIDCGFKEYLKGECAGLPSEFALGRAANYMPIPFAKSILITAPGFHFPGYYQVSYQTYDPSVPVKSFRKSEALSAPSLAEARKVWAGGPLAGISRELTNTAVELELAPGQAAAAVKLDGAGVIRALSIKDAANPADPLTGLKLRIFWDGSSEPAVDVPLDAFFLNRFDLKTKWPGGSLKNLFVAAGPDGYTVTFPMPFRQGAVVQMVNGDMAKKLAVKVAWEPKAELPPDSLRFHAFYRSQDYETDPTEKSVIKNKTPIDPAGNYVVLDRKGRGQYLGCAIFVESVGTTWWGEGDEMDYIDGATQPQIQGTGTEDEFNWSWGFNPHMSPVSGTLPVVPACKESIVAQLVPQLKNPECQKLTGHNIAYRFRPTDYVPFASSLKVSYEVLGQSWLAPNSFAAGNLSQLRGDDYSSIAFWYEEP